MADYDKPRGHDLPPGVVHADANVESQNWIRQSWPLAGPASYQADMIAGDRRWPPADAQQLGSVAVLRCAQPVAHRTRVPELRHDSRSAPRWLHAARPQWSHVPRAAEVRH